MLGGAAKAALQGPVELIGHIGGAARGDLSRRVKHVEPVADGQFV
jgi:hypothetical protein